MALTKGINSHVTVAEADAFFADKLDVNAWVIASADQKSQALITATSILDDLPWIGTAISESQSLAFPREGSYYDPRLGANITFDANTPQRVILATKELSYHLLNNDGLMDNSGSALNISLGGISLSNVKAPEVLPRSIKKIILPLLNGGGTRSWWRSN